VRRSVYCTASFSVCSLRLAKFPIIYPDLRLDYKVATHPAKQPSQLHEDEFLRIFWDEQTRIIGIDWMEATSEMTDEDFKTELTLFAKQVEDKKAPRILIDVSKFRHRPGAEIGEWRLKNISTRYNAAGVTAICVSLFEGFSDSADGKIVSNSIVQ
jgi:hypothetical protein